MIVSCALAGAAFAQATSPAGSPSTGAGAQGVGSSTGAAHDFGSMDTNKDGKVSSTEAQSNSELRSAFSTLDADKDTYLSQSEFAKWSAGGKSGGMSSSGGASSGADRSSSGGASSNSSSSGAPSSSTPRTQSSDSSSAE